MSPNTVGAVVVAYNPPPGFEARVQAARAQVDTLVVIDNGPRNIGIAAALNAGIERVAAAGCEWALLLDHDSTPAPDMVQRLLAGARHPAARDAAALVPRIRFEHPDIRCRWPSTAPGARVRFSFVYADALREPHAVDLAIGSGMLLNIAAWRRLGPFREALFVDLVDTEYCLRTRSAGATVVAVPDAELQHAIGHVQQRRVPGLPPMYPTHHAPVRHYYLARNRMLLARDYACRLPSWFVFELSSAAKLLVKSVLFERDRWQKLYATLLGTWDGLLGRGGPCLRKL